MKKTACLIDASPYIFRAYFALPATMVDRAGNAANAVYGFATFLCQLLEETQPTHALVAFDGSLTTSFRNEIFPQYKAQRELPPPELEAQMEACRRLASLLGFAVAIDERYEADDLIGTAATRLRPVGFRMLVVSNDKDLAQLVRDGDVLWDPARDRRLDRNGVYEQMGVYPEQVVDYLALVGDKVDNIPGVPGIGPVTAAKLLAAFGDLDSLLAEPGRVAELPLRGAAGVAKKIAEHADQIRMSRRLATIATDAPGAFDAAALERRTRQDDALKEFLDQMNFGERLRSRIAALPQP